MKKQFFILVIVALMGVLASCEKNEDVVPQEQSKEVNKSVMRTSAPYSRSRAVSYALTYSEQWTSCSHESGDDRKNCTHDYNSSDYKDWATNMIDCANFISQVLDYAYISQDATWRYDDKGTSTTSDDGASSAWLGASALYDYLTGEYYTSLYSVTGITDIDYSYYLDDAEVGDLVFELSRDNSGGYNHVMVVTGVPTNSNGAYDIKLTGHTWNNRNSSFNTYFLQANPSKTYRIVKL